MATAFITGPASASAARSRGPSGAPAMTWRSTRTARWRRWRRWPTSCGRSAASVTLYTADLSSPEAVDALGAEVRAGHPALDVLVHNAGLYERVAFASITREQYRDDARR